MNQLSYIVRHVIVDKETIFSFAIRCICNCNSPAVIRMQAFSFSQFPKRKYCLLVPGWHVRWRCNLAGCPWARRSRMNCLRARSSAHIDTLPAIAGIVKYAVICYRLLANKFTIYYVGIRSIFTLDSRLLYVIDTVGIYLPR